MCCQRNVYAKQSILNNMTHCQLTKINIQTAVELRLQFHNGTPLSRAANLLMTDSKSTEYNVFFSQLRSTPNLPASHKLQIARTALLT
jgi:hypothetical protein